MSLLALGILMGFWTSGVIWFLCDLSRRDPDMELNNGDVDEHEQDHWEDGR